MKFKTQWLEALKTMRYKSYWNKPNTVEFFAFMTKIAIIFPGLLLGKQVCFDFKFIINLVVNSKNITNNNLV
jgi:hypothetical protein